eukprot:1159145-Pelagomonas_calceolata.AAC.30
MNASLHAAARSVLAAVPVAWEWHAGCGARDRTGGGAGDGRLRSVSLLYGQQCKWSRTWQPWCQGEGGGGEALLLGMRQRVWCKWWFEWL